jgi:uncharacterized protein YukJ
MPIGLLSILSGVLMPLLSYGVLKGKAREMIIDAENKMHIKVSNGSEFRVSFSINSPIGPSAMLYFFDEDFHHPITRDLRALPFGFYPLKREPGGLASKDSDRMALDYVRGYLFETSRMNLLPHDMQKIDNELIEFLNKYAGRSIHMHNSVIYVFGSHWGPEADFSDAYFNFLPGNGIYKIHMNQGNIENWEMDDGVWQDGGILFEFPDDEKWVAFFMAFQSQCFKTDDRTGHRNSESCGITSKYERWLIRVPLSEDKTND